jgi:hypothetical protein
MGTRAALVAVGVLVAMVLGVSAASATVRFVCLRVKPKCAYTSVQAAINGATTGETIHIGPGTYSEHLEIPGSGSATSLTLQGSDGGGTTINNIYDPEDRAVVKIGPGVMVTIAKLTITEGYATQPYEAGGITNEGTLTVKNSTIFDNDNEVGSVGGGGGITNVGTLTVKNSTISDNYSSFVGGGIFSEGTMTVTHSTVSENQAFAGGGIWVSGTLSLYDSTVSGNTALGAYENPSLAGGITNGGTLTGRRDTISGNTPNGIVDEGGGTTNLTNSVVQSP